MQKILALILFVVIWTSCSKESELVDEILRPYMESFREEGAIRGIKVDYHERPVEMRLEFHDGNVRLGWCNYNDHEPNKVIINTLFWDILDDLEKEKLVFHELGHCVLFRPHLDTIRQDGRCKSIMHSGQACSDDYTISTRSTYLDELFLRK